MSFKINIRGVLVFIVTFTVVLSAGVSGSIEGAEDHLWSVILSALMIGLGVGYIANKTKNDD